MLVPVVAAFKRVKFKRKSGNVITVHTSEQHAVVCPPSCLKLTIAIHHSAVSGFDSEHPSRAIRIGLKRAEEECVHT